MKKGEKAWFAWRAGDGRLNFDSHGNGGRKSAVYKKGRGVAGGEGLVEAPISGDRGWFWLNCSKKDVTLILRSK